MGDQNNKHGTCLPRLIPLLGTALLIGVSGCAHHESEQFFAVRDPDTGAANYYKLTIEGSGGGGTDYKMQAGYFSSASVDVLRGQMPKIAELDLPIEQLEVYDALLEEFYGFVLEQAKSLANRTDKDAIALVSQSMSTFTKSRVDRLQADIDARERARKDGESALKGAETELDDANKKLEQSRSEFDAATKQAASDAEKMRTLQDDLTASAQAQPLLDKALTDLSNESQHLQADRTELNKANETAANDLNKLNDEFAKLKQTQPNDDTTIAAKEKDIAAKKDEIAKLESLKSEADASDKKLQQEINEATTKRKEGESKIAELTSQLGTAKLAARSSARAAARAGQARDNAERLARRRQSVVDGKRSFLRSIEVEIGQMTAEKTRLAAAAKTAADRASRSAGALAGVTEGVSSHLGPMPKEQFETQIVRLARTVWYGSLSGADIASVGMTEDTNPFQFRKLVFWATAKNLDLNQFAGEIDSVIDDATSIASAFKANTKARKQQAAQAKHVRQAQIAGGLGVIRSAAGLGPMEAMALDAILSGLKAGDEPPPSNVEEAFQP